LRPDGFGVDSSSAMPDSTTGAQSGNSATSEIGSHRLDGFPQRRQQEIAAFLQARNAVLRDAERFRNAHMRELSRASDYLKNCGIDSKPALEADNLATAISLIASTRSVVLLPAYVQDFLSWSAVSRPLSRKCRRSIWWAGTTKLTRRQS
jgi:hypothetical protein